MRDIPRSISKDFKAPAKRVTWERLSSIADKADSYETFVVNLCRDTRYIQIMQNVITSTVGLDGEANTIASAIVNIAYDLDYCLPILQSLLEHSLETSAPHAQDIFSEHSLLTRMFSCYCFKVCPVFLHVCLGGPRGVAAKLFTSDLKTSTEQQLEVMTTLLEQVMDSRVVNLIPRGLRAMCHVINMKCSAMPHKYSPEKRFELIAYLLLMVVIFPGLQEQDHYYLLATNTTPNARRRINLTIVRTELMNLIFNTRSHAYDTPLPKTAQNPSTTTQNTPSLSPSSPLTPSSPNANSSSPFPPHILDPSHMQTIDNLLESFSQRIPTWIESISRDPRKMKGIVAWPEAFHAQFPRTLEFSEISPVDIVRLHYSVKIVVDKVANNVQLQGMRHSGVSSSSLNELVVVLRDCPVVETPLIGPHSGALPSSSSSLRKSFNISPRISFAKISPLSSSASTPAISSGSTNNAPSSRTNSSENSSEHSQIQRFDVREESQNSIFPDAEHGCGWFICIAKNLGGSVPAQNNNNNQQPQGGGGGGGERWERSLVFLLSVRRMEANFVDNIERTIQTMDNVAQHALNSVQRDSSSFSGISLIIDLAYSRIPWTVIYRIITSLPFLHLMFSRLHWVRELREIFILGPNDTSHVIKQCLHRVPALTNANVIELEHWKIIRDSLTCGSKPVMIPEDSQQYIPGAYYVGVMEDTWKRRAIKIGPWSVLHFEGNILRSEIRLEHFEKLEHDGRIIVLEYLSVGEIASRASTLRSLTTPRKRSISFRFLTTEIAEQFIKNLVHSIVSLLRPHSPQSQNNNNNGQFSSPSISSATNGIGGMSLDSLQRNEEMRRISLRNASHGSGGGGGGGGGSGLRPLKHGPSVTSFTTTKRISNRANASGKTRQLYVMQDCLISLNSHNAVKSIWPLEAIKQFKHDPGSNCISFFVGDKQIELGGLDSEQNLPAFIQQALTYSQRSLAKISQDIATDLDQISALDFLQVKLNAAGVC